MPEEPDIASLVTPDSDRVRRIAIIAPNFFGYSDRIKLACQDLGYQCMMVDERIGNGFLAKSLTRLGIVQRVRRWRLAHVKGIAASLVTYRADNVLVLNPETLCASDIEYLRNQLPAARFVMYRWDSASKKATNSDLVGSFDRCYSFDPVDCRNIDGLEHLPLFHSHKTLCENESLNYQYLASFIGTGRIRRVFILSRIAKSLNLNIEKIFFYLYAPSIFHYIVLKLVASACRYPGKVSRMAVPYARYSHVIANSRINIDIEQNNQNGLTIRTIEAVFTGRPLITSNSNITIYDFWDAFPVAVFDRRSAELPHDRSVGPIAKQELFDKYGIAQWLTTLIEERRGEYFRMMPTSSTLQNES